MKKKVQTGFIIGMIFLHANSFCQSVVLTPEKKKEEKEIDRKSTRLNSSQ